MVDEANFPTQRSEASTSPSSKRPLNLMQFLYKKHLFNLFTAPHTSRWRGKFPDMSLLIFQSSKTIDMIQFLSGLSCRIIPKSPTCNFPIFHPNYQKSCTKKNMSALCLFLLSFVSTKCHALQKAGPGGTRYQPPQQWPDLTVGTAGSICEVALNSQIFHGANPKKEQSNCISFHESALFELLAFLHLLMAWIEGEGY